MGLCRLGRRQPERYIGLGWAIAAWFVPIVNLFLPKRIVGELIHGATAGPDDLPTVVRLNRWTTAWWTSWLLTLAAGVIAHLASNSADTANRALGATWTYLVRDVLLVVSAVLAIRCVQLLCPVAIAVHRLVKEQGMTDIVTDVVAPDPTERPEPDVRRRRKPTNVVLAVVSIVLLALAVSALFYGFGAQSTRRTANQARALRQEECVCPPTDRGRAPPGCGPRRGRNRATRLEELGTALGTTTDAERA